MTKTKKRADAQASTPRDFSWKSWKRILGELWSAIGSKNLQMYAAGIAYFSVLSFFPLMAVIVAIAGLVVQPEQLSGVADTIAQYLPRDVAALVTSQLDTAVTNRSGSWILLAVGAVLSILGVSGAVSNMMTALNHTYETKDERSLFRRQFVSIGLTIFMVIGTMLLGAVFVGGNGWLTDFGMPREVIAVASWARWLVMIVGAIFGLSVLYRFGPDRSSRRKWQWISWGAIIATLLWIVVSVLFFVYLQYFGNYSRNYSTYAGIIGMMVWLNYSALVVLLGAEINHQLERK